MIDINKLKVGDIIQYETMNGIELDGVYLEDYVHETVITGILSHPTKNNYVMVSGDKVLTEKQTETIKVLE